MKKQKFMRKHGPNSKDKACSAALDWIASLPKNYNSKQIWFACKRSDWMLWYLERTVDNNDPRFRLMACAFVRRTPKGDGKTTWDLLTDERLKNAVIVAEKYATGEATRDDLDRAADAAADAAYASYSAYTTARAAHTTARAAHAAQCDIIREFFPEP